MEGPEAARRIPSPVRRLAFGFTLATLAVRGMRLGVPSVLVFDEVFYANDAGDLAREGVVQGSPSHPPLGAWMISLGVRLAGFDAVGWRLVPLVAGAVVVGLAVLLAWRLTASTAAASVAGVVVSTDGIAFVTGRLALLDGLLALWVTAAVLVLATAASRPLDARLHRQSAWVASGLVGLAMATKWSAVLLVPVAVVTLVVLDLGVWGRLPELRRRAATTTAVVLLVPIGVYAVVHLPDLVRYERTHLAEQTCGEACGVVDRLDGVVDRHVDLVAFHRELRPDNRYAAGAMTWLAQTHPTGLYVDGSAAGTGSEDRRVAVLAAGNPLLWVLGSAALLGGVALAVHRRDGAALVTAVSGLVFVVPWLLAREGYAFYGAPVVPLFAATMVWVGRVTLGPVARRRAGAAVVGVAVVGFLWSYPLLTGWSLPDGVSDTLAFWPGWS